MKRAEIEKKFDQIVAFAVAAHRSAERSCRSLEREILLVDEVLAMQRTG